MTARQLPVKGFRFPILQGILPLNSAQVPADLMAGITLAALNIPQALGYTEIASTPVITGLYALLLPMSLFAVFGSSRHLVVGADSATAAILPAGLSDLAVSGSPEYMGLCGLLALLAAGLLILARLIGLNFLADFLSRTVLVGFLTGVGIQVSLMEVGGMLGLPREGSNPVIRLFHDLQQLSATDVDGDTLTYALIGNGQVFTVDNVLLGQVNLHSDGAYTFTPALNAQGTGTFQYCANDGQAESNPATVTITVTPVNDAPVAMPATASGNEDTIITGTLNAGDVDGNSLSYRLVGAAKNGTVTVKSDGSFS